MKRIILCLALAAIALPAAAETGFQFATVNHESPRDPNVNGARISFLHARAQSVRGLDFGILSLAETSRLSGVALVFGISKVDDGMTGGASFSFVNIRSGTDSGLNAAFINKVNTVKSGMNLGFLNIADGSTTVDLGGLNASKASGVQLGFVNFTERIDTLQLGFINIAENGFLPIFPFFNFPRN